MFVVTIINNYDELHVGVYTTMEEVVDRLYGWARKHWDRFIDTPFDVTADRKEVIQQYFDYMNDGDRYGVAKNVLVGDELKHLRINV